VLFGQSERAPSLPPLPPSQSDECTTHARLKPTSSPYFCTLLHQKKTSVPDGGQVFVVFGPHVAISPSGEVGKYARIGQSHDSTACGACIGALAAVDGAPELITNNPQLQKNEEVVFSDMHNRQIEFLIAEVRKRHGAICAHKMGKQVGLAYEAFELAKDMMLASIDTSILNGGKLVLLGGIQINAPAPLDDFFLPLYFQMHQNKKKTVDWLSRLQGNSFKAAVASQITALDSSPLTSPSTNALGWIGHLELAGSSVDSAQQKVLTDALGALQTNFPGAMANKPLMTLIDKSLESRGFNADDTLFGSGVCPDEINHEKGDLPGLMTERFGEQFKLGGLGGVPFAGKAGFGAFAHHVPEGGKIFVLFGSHVAISPTGEIGLYKRKGQKKSGTSCGTCIKAFKTVEAQGAAEAAKSTTNMYDMQCNYWVQQLAKRYDAICAHKKGKMVGLAFESFEEIKEAMLDSIDTSILNGGDLVLLGGIQVNMPAPLDDFFLPLYFSLHNHGKEPVNYLPKLDEESLFNVRADDQWTTGGATFESPPEEETAGFGGAAEE
jgi:hypothetical protein